MSNPRTPALQRRLEAHLDVKGSEDESTCLKLQNPDSPRSSLPGHDTGYLDREPQMLLQPNSKPLDSEQLIVESKAIYARLVKAESICMDRDVITSPEAKNQRWRLLIKLHKQLLHEHHDYYLASHHPSASPALSALVSKHRLPKRMWLHGVLGFLETLRQSLPESYEHMSTFIHIAHGLITSLYELVSKFQGTWAECLGMLGVYRMIMEDEPKKKKLGRDIAAYWFKKAVGEHSDSGRLLYHQARVARPCSPTQQSPACPRTHHILSTSQPVIFLAQIDKILGELENGGGISDICDDLYSSAHKREERLLWLTFSIISDEEQQRYDREAKSFQSTNDLNESLTADMKIEPESLDQDKTLTTPGSDVEAVQHTPSDNGSTSSEVATPETGSVCDVSDVSDFVVLSISGSKSIE